MWRKSQSEGTASELDKDLPYLSIQTKQNLSISHRNFTEIAKKFTKFKLNQGLFDVPFAAKVLNDTKQPDSLAANTGRVNSKSEK